MPNIKSKKEISVEFKTFQGISFQKALHELQFYGEACVWR